MKDAEISLAVAKVIHPEYEWALYDGDECPTCLGDDFDYTRNHCSWDMVLWWTYNFHKYHKESGLAFILLSHNPQRALAMAIIEAASGGLTDD